MTEPSDVLTFLFSDIEGSTRLWEQQPDAMRSALARHDAVARAAVEAHGGHVVKTTGDGLHAAFDCSADALQAVLRLQLALDDPAATGGLPLRVRCGLHAGPHERRGGDFYGPAVNRAARISSAAHGGQTLLSQAVFERVGGRLPPDTALRDLGAVRLRDLAEPERVYQLLHPKLRAQFPPLRSLEATPNNLAQQLNSFVGREHELAEAKRLLAGNRLLTLLGMGGIGKSRLSVQLGADVLDDYPDGVWLIELAPLTDPRGVPQAVAAVVGVKEDAGCTVAESLCRYVRDKRVLFILDNCEHLLHACAELAKQLLQAGAGVKLLATSRAALQVAGETCCTVSTLSVPDPRRPAAADDLTRHEAVRLFVDRATAARAAFRLSADNAAAVADICHRLDGIPLAIELAAARTRALSAEAIAARLSDRFRLLVSGDRTVLPRQRTLRALIDWSHDLLSEPERALFRRLAVFAGGWTLDAAEAVGGGAGDDGGDLRPGDVLDVLAQLVEKSLVVMDAGGGRYRMLDTVRHYAQERLQAHAAEQAAVQTRHLLAYLGFAESARPHLAGPQQGAWLARLDLERENFLSAHRFSRGADGDDHSGLRLMHALRPYWIRRGSLSTGLAVAQELLDRDGLQPRDAARCMALFGAGQMSLFAGDHARAREHLLECLSIAREIHDSAVIARVLQPLGAISCQQRRFDEAGAYLEEALTLAEAHGDRRETAAALIALASLNQMQGRLDCAATLCERALALARALGDQQTVGIAQLNLVMAAIGGGRYSAAAPMLLEVADLAELTASELLAQSLMDVCAELAAACRRWTDSAVFFGAAEAWRGEAGLRRDPADAAFLEPLMSDTRAALGNAAFSHHEAIGRARQRPSQWALMRQWLADWTQPPG